MLADPSPSPDLEKATAQRAQLGRWLMAASVLGIGYVVWALVGEHDGPTYPVALLALMLWVIGHRMHRGDATASWYGWD